MPSAATAITIAGKQAWDEVRRVVYGRAFQTNGERVVRCAWTDAPAIAFYLMGGAQLIGGVVVFQPAQAFSPQLPYLYPETISQEGEGAKSQDANGDVAYERAVLTMRYTPLGIEENGSQDIEFGKEIISLPGDGLKWNGTSTPLPFSVPITIPTAAVTQSKANMASLPIAAILAAFAAPLDNSGLFGSQTETLLIDGGRAARTFTSAGITNWTVQYRWLYKPAPAKWGYFLDPSDGTFKKVVRKDGTSLYLASNHSALL
jgi:hypothetical protein